MRHIIPFLLLLIVASLARAEAYTTPTLTKQGAAIALEIGQIAIDTSGLTSALEQLAQAVSQLSSQHRQLSTTERRSLLLSLTQIRELLDATTTMIEKLPATVEQFVEKMPQALQGANQSVAFISQSVSETARVIDHFRSDLPALAENTVSHIDAATDRLLGNIFLYIVVILLGVALLGILALWYVRRYHINPLCNALSVFAAAPGQLFTAAECLNNAAGLIEKVSAELKTTASLQAQDKATAAPQKQ